MNRIENNEEFKPRFVVAMIDEDAFRLACQNGHLEVANWILEKKPQLCVLEQNNFAFRLACQHGHLSVAQWLWNKNPT